MACETFITVGTIIVGGEITTSAKFEPKDVVKNVLTDIGYTDPKFGFDINSCEIINKINKQSSNIAQGVDTGGAGDQGLMVGYASDETSELMPLPITLSHNLTMQLTDIRKKGVLGYLGPDGKSQVTVEYYDGKPKKVTAVVLSTQHTEEILDKTGERITKESAEEIKKIIIDPILKGWTDENTKYHINPTGKFVIGGPQADTGMTGRKIIVDTYGGMAPHGGGAFSGKDPTKVDRSASYMARYIAKNIVAAGIAKKCVVQLAYAIGVAEPVSVFVDTLETSSCDNKKIEATVRKVFGLTPKAIIASLDLLKPIYRNTAAYGHFGRSGFSWEKTDKVAELQRLLK